jgi:hypothetical protein
MDSTETKLSQDVVFDILSSPRRRYVLYYLRTTDEPVQLTDLAEQVAAWEHDTVPEEITEQERKRVYVSLYQTHVPRLAEVGIIEYDKDSGYISLAEDTGSVDEYLSSPAETLPWQRIYLTVAVLGTVLLGVTVLDVVFFAAIPEVVAAFFVVAAFIITAISHYIRQLSQKRTIPAELHNRD